MFPPVFPILSASPAIVAIVGPAPLRIYEGEAPQSPLAPYIVWLIVDGVPEVSLEIRPTTDRDVVQIDCYHSTAAGVRSLAQAVRDAMEPVCVMTGVVAHERGTVEPRLFRVALQFDMFTLL